MPHWKHSWDVKSGRLMSPSEIKQYEDDGWEMCGFAAAPDGHGYTNYIYYFKKRRQEGTEEGG